MLAKIKDIQSYLARHQIDGWLIFDFRGQNHIASNIFNLKEARILTRRWFYFIPQKGEACLLVHKIERNNFPNPPSQTSFYVSWQELRSQLAKLLKDSKKIAMEYSPRGAIPYVSCVDGGTLEFVRDLGVEVVSSANLVQYFKCRWSVEQLESHKRAVKNLDAIKDQAFALVRDYIQSKKRITEYDVQAFILEGLDKHNMWTEEPPIVAVNGNASNPHYAPTADTHSPITTGDLLLIDLFGKEKEKNSVYADITWMGYVGSPVPDKYSQIFEVIARARDTGVQVLREAADSKRTIQGWEVDNRVRQVVTDAGYGQYFDHRTGHSLNTNLHGSGVNIDGLETQDEREIIPGLGFTIEPGIYLDEFGLRTEINVYYSETGPMVFSPIQKEIVAVLEPSHETAS